MTERSFELAINVLGYKEDDDWVALALEMDIRGYGETFADALGELSELIDMQVTFALQKKQSEMIYSPADPIWFERFAEVRRERLAALATPSSESASYQVAGLTLPDPHVIAALIDPGFSRVDA